MPQRAVPSRDAPPQALKAGTAVFFVREESDFVPNVEELRARAQEALDAEEGEEEEDFSDDDGVRCPRGHYSGARHRSGTQEREAHGRGWPPSRISFLRAQEGVSAEHARYVAVPGSMRFCAPGENAL